MADRGYAPKDVEAKWTRYWEDKGVYKTNAIPKDKAYVLGMFPYPSGDGLHTGHGRIFTAVDVVSRYLRMKGRDVLMPVGWDAFGLPAENAAIKAKTNPMTMVPKNEANFKRQMQMLGLSFDWDRSFSTTDPEYYKWTQWIFLKLYSKKNEKGERLIYRKEVAINWCPKCLTGLANEEVEADGTHERCGTLVTQRMLPQWVMRITDYSDRLLDGLTQLDWPRGILEMQKSWIGRKEGVKIRFRLVIPTKMEGSLDFARDDSREIEVFTTRLDTILGVTFIVVSPKKVKEWITAGFEASKAVVEYIEKSLSKSEQQRLEEVKDKTGVDTNVKAINPVSGDVVPVYVADYVLSEVGTGAVMGVPFYDERDREFAVKMDLPMGSGKLIDPKEVAMGTKEVYYHLRDWIFSRQRYWGEPIPLIYCPKCGDENGVVTVPEDQLPLKLPYLDSYEPTDDGRSPLSRVDEFIKTKCPVCGGEARRETDTMPNWAGSCWYFLRFAVEEYSTLHPSSSLEEGKREKSDRDMDSFWKEEITPEISKWLPVDWYLGGAEHAVLHLLYARFWVKALYDLGYLSFDEPFKRLRSVGMVLAVDGKKMSKSLGNTVNPDDVVDKFGADAVRIYEMFMGPWDQVNAWDERSLIGCRRFLDKVWGLMTGGRDQGSGVSDAKLVRDLEKLIEKVGKDIEEFKFNTAIAAMMKFANSVQSSENRGQSLRKEDWERFLKILAPFAPFVAEELYQEVTKLRSHEVTNSIHKSAWPTFVSNSDVDEEKTFIVQVNGKVRGTIQVESIKTKDKSELERLALADEKIKKWVGGKEYKTVVVPGRLINFVLK